MIIIINRFVKRHKVVTSEALGAGSMLVSRERRESLGEEECYHKCLVPQTEFNIVASLKHWHNMC